MPSRRQSANENQPLLLTPTNKKSNAARRSLLVNEGSSPYIAEPLTEQLVAIKENISKEKQFMAVRITFWTAEGLVFAYIFFGETTATLTKYLQQIGAKIGFSLAVMDYVEVGTIVTNGPFNAVVSLETMQMVLDHVRFIRSDASMAEKGLHLALFVPLQLAAITIGCISSLAQISNANLATKIGAMFQILPGNAAGTKGIGRFLVHVSQVARTRAKIIRGVLSQEEHYKNRVAELLYNTNVAKKQWLVAAIKNQTLTADQTTALKILLDRVHARLAANLPPSGWKKYLGYLFISNQTTVNFPELTSAQQEVLTKFIIDITADQQLPMDTETKLVWCLILTVLQFYALLGVMYIGDQALREFLAGSFLEIITNFYLPYVVFGGMMLAFSLGLMQNLSPLLNNPIRVADSPAHKFVFVMFLGVFASMLAVSWDGAAQALLKAVLELGLKLPFLDPFGGFVFNTLSVVLSNGMASIGLISKIYVAISGGIFKSESVLEALLVDAVLEEANNALPELIDNQPNLTLITTKLQQLPAPPRERPANAVELA